MPRKADPAVPALCSAAPLERWRSFLATALCSALLAACATTQAPPNSGLDGQWQLDAAASDNVTRVVTAAVSRAQTALRSRRGSFGGVGRRAGGSANHGGGGSRSGGGPGSSGGAGSGSDEDLDTATDVLGSNTLLGPDFQDLRAHLLQTLSASARLSVEVKPDEFEVQRDDLPPRDYQAGERITRYDEYGTANLSSRWQGKAFELRERYTSGARLVERYEVDPSGALVYTRTMVDPTVGKLTVRSVYHRVGTQG